ncbi:TPA: hypothetical protein I9Y78_003640 [Elizabethkingia anophelis]|uniref:hypothetical protein n=1 Tax=Elizabethkingia anophelis TaxID=1117645 RepID=UPI0005529C42|nr:hypothetical protein [Elizabethkingia anophelis]MCT3746766.1 hypothetical protein [Elizabethkingia anophelis]MDC8028135.1 hypothetical protein [Elizabethkingia anophelis]MDV3493300.1 hypothetical protein [Elizabethkingia anophelis]MDV4132250.1 hypothetical protein [Elizabethkingia anophelis]MDV4136048.1 hypothetical protein [Elizabethkingia anophelis]
MSTNNSQGQLSGDSPSSKIDLFSGKHTTSLIVAALFLIVFIGLIIYLILKDNYENIILNGMFSLLSLLGGFFAGSNMKK